MNDLYKYGYAEFCGKIYPFVRIIEGQVFLMDVVGRKGFDTIVRRVSDVKILKYPNTEFGELND